jgi:hypothetical protein
VPGKVGLELFQGLYNKIVDWYGPVSNRDCVTKYIIEWLNTVSGSGGKHELSSDVSSYTIQGLDACVEYAVSVTAVNADEIGEPGTGTATPESAGNYHTHIILLCL